MVADIDLLDQLSTSHTPQRNDLLSAGVSMTTIRETEALIEEAELNQAARCENGAPFIFFVDHNGKGRLIEGCCNDWTCPRCGIKRAKKEYGRMVHGAKTLHEAGRALFFVTLTCRGKEMSLEDAEAGYLGWTDKTLTAMRNRCKRKGGHWTYSGVTERQQRGHPHSHYQMSWVPDDAVPFSEGDMLPSGAIAKRDCLYSAWMTGTATRAGLGKMTDITPVKSPVGVAVYQAKYMFKDAALTVWPKGWRRVRYARNWPKLPVNKPEIAFPLLRLQDWQRMAALEMTVYADCEATLEAAYVRHVVCVKYIKQ